MFCPIALQLYSVRNELQKDFPGTLAQVKEMGYDGVSSRAYAVIPPNR